jgi:hypothetical protein
MTPSEHDLIILAEECAEISEQCCRLAIRISKALRFAPDEVMPGQPFNNLQRLKAELNDLVGAAEASGLIDREQVEAKKAKIRKFAALSRACGMLDGETPGEKNVKTT